MKFLSHSYSDRTIYNCLDGVRGMAFLAVVLSHLSGGSFIFFQGVGKQGVWLFFVLSSFLLTLYFVSNPAKSKVPMEWVNFFVRRFFRIYPLFFIVVMYTYYIQKVWTKEITVNHLILNAGAGPFWTIPVEMTFYLCIPVMVYLMKHSILVNIIFVALFTIIHQFIFPVSQMQINDFHLAPYLPVFMIGCLAAKIHVELTKKQIPLDVKKWFDIGSLSILLGCFLTIPKVYSLLFVPVSFDYFHRGFIFYGIVWSAFIVFLLNGNGLMKKIFENRLLRWFGVVSYSGYLTHSYVIEAIHPYIKTSWLLAIPILISVLIVATCVHFLIERPCMGVNLLKRNRSKKVIFSS